MLVPTKVVEPQIDIPIYSVLLLSKKGPVVSHCTKKEFHYYKSQSNIGAHMYHTG